MSARASKSSVLKLLVLLCISAQHLPAQRFAPGSEVVAHYLDRWEFDEEWGRGEHLPPGYSAGAEATLVTFWNSDLTGYCSCELRECHLSGQMLGEHWSDPGTPCVAFGGAIRLLAEFSRRAWRPRTLDLPNSTVDDPKLEWDRRLMLGLDQTIRRRLEPGRNRVGDLLKRVCADLRPTFDGEGPCSTATQFGGGPYMERIEIELPDLKERRLAKLTASNPTAAVESIRNYLRSRRAASNKPESGPCGPAKLTLPRFLESDSSVLGYSQRAICGYEILIFERSPDGSWEAVGAVENTKYREIYKQKILDKALVTITLEVMGPDRGLRPRRQARKPPRSLTVRVVFARGSYRASKRDRGKPDCRMMLANVP